jgi:hypothetical protein
MGERLSNKARAKNPFAALQYVKQCLPSPPSLYPRERKKEGLSQSLGKLRDVTEWASGIALHGSESNLMLQCIASMLQTPPPPPGEECSKTF